MEGPPAMVSVAGMEGSVDRESHDEGKQASICAIYNTRQFAHGVDNTPKRKGTPILAGERRANRRLMSTTGVGSWMTARLNGVSKARAVWYGVLFEDDDEAYCGRMARMRAGPGTDSAYCCLFSYEIDMKVESINE